MHSHPEISPVKRSKYRLGIVAHACNSSFLGETSLGKNLSKIPIISINQVWWYISIISVTWEAAGHKTAV
jgi:hypothetical protein